MKSSKNLPILMIFYFKWNKQVTPIKQGKHLAFKNKQQNLFGLHSLGEGYSEKSRKLLTAKNLMVTENNNCKQQPQSIFCRYTGKITVGKGRGYERWAKIFNLKQMAQTINF